MSDVFIMSSVHKWDDSRIYYKEALSLSKNYSVELHALADFKCRRGLNLSVYGLPKYNKRYKRILNWVRLFIRAMKSDAQIFHFHDPELIPLALIIKKIKNVKIIYDVHEDYAQSILNKYWINKNIRSYISEKFNNFEKRSSKKFDLNINVIEHISHKFENLGAKVLIVKNYPLQNNKTREYSLFKEKDAKIVYVGALSEERGICAVIDSLDFIRSRNIQLIVAGKCANEDIKLKIKKKENEDERLKYLGELTCEKVKALLDSCDIGLVCLQKLAQYENSLPVKMFEYMASKIPIIATQMTYWVKSFSEFNCIHFISEVTSENIAEAIDHLSNNKEKAVCMGENGYNAFVNYLNWETEEKKLLSAYKYLFK
jgi:glycosyltransferase involved in cell wall biosynthesis